MTLNAPANVTLHFIDNVWPLRCEPKDPGMRVHLGFIVAVCVDCCWQDWPTIHQCGTYQPWDVKLVFCLRMLYCDLHGVWDNPSWVRRNMSAPQPKMGRMFFSSTVPGPFTDSEMIMLTQHTSHGPYARSPEMQALRDYVTAADGTRYANQASLDLYSKPLLR